MSKTVDPAEPGRVTSCSMGEPLSERDKAILDFEKKWWRHTGAKEQAIYDLFDMNQTRYTQLLLALVERPQAQMYAPTVVRRVRARKASR